MANPNVNERGYIYGKWHTGPATWTIMLQGSPHFIYLLIGEEKAMLIDTFYGQGDLRAFVETITDKPLIVADTHGHFDHTGGNAFWEECWMSEPATHDCKHAFGEEMQKHMNAMPHPDYKCRVIADGEKIDLGGRIVECIAIGAHHPGSMAFLDHGERQLFTGDELDGGQVLLSRENVPTHLANMEKLKARAAEFDVINPAHNGTHLMPGILDDFIALDKAIIAGTIEPLESSAGFGWPEGGAFGGGKSTRYNLGEAHICV